MQYLHGLLHLKGVKNVMRWFLPVVILGIAAGCSKERIVPDRYEFDAEWAAASYFGPDALGYVDQYQLDLAQGRTDEDLALIESTFGEYSVEFTYAETAYGTKLLIARETGDEEDFVSIISIYKGYMVEFLMSPGEGSATLTDEQIQQCIAFLSELDFVAVE